MGFFSKHYINIIAFEYKLNKLKFLFNLVPIYSSKCVQYREPTKKSLIDAIIFYYPESNSNSFDSFNQSDLL